MFRQMKLPVLFNSCITLSLGEMMMVSSSISLQGSEGFVRHTPAAGTCMKARRPKRIDPSGTAGCNREFPRWLRRGFREGACDRLYQRKKTKRREARI